MTISSIGATNNRFIGLSTDTKPYSANTGATFLEYDTGCLFAYTGLNWFLKTNPDHLFSVTTVDLNQSAGDYDLFTAGDYDVQLLEFGLIIPADLTGDAAGFLTSISVHSTDTSSVEIISATTGAKANLSENEHFIYNGADTVAATKKIQLTITGGATTAEQICSVWLKYQEVFS